MKVILIACNSHVLMESVIIREMMNIKVEQCLIADQQKKVDISLLKEPEPFMIKSYDLTHFEKNNIKKRHYTDQPWKKHFKR